MHGGQLTFEFTNGSSGATSKQAARPSGYKGLYGFHKYWGKKPYEPIAFVIEQLTEPGDTVLDPFVGSGTASRESLMLNRRFIGIDINPVAVALSRLLSSPPAYDAVEQAFDLIASEVQEEINKTYSLADERTASHYLWEGKCLKQVWIKGGAGKKRQELEPSSHDKRLIASFNSYHSRQIDSLQFFSNGRINARADLTINDLLTKRAQYNIDKLLEAIVGLPKHLQEPMLLCLTAASGQMTKMVFAVTGRGKTTGEKASKIEVGSWVIGYWRPNLHFEVNVWNCFERRVSKLMNAIRQGDELQGTHLAENLSDFYEMNSPCCIECSPCQSIVSKIAPRSVRLIFTDPPHSDRIPYLELSEFWNSILGVPSNFDEEIVISNAKERNKEKTHYDRSMKTLFENCGNVLCDDGHLVILYNARKDTDWEFIRELSSSNFLDYVGCFPCQYSAGSVVQDNRKGGLKYDFAVVFSKHGVGCNQTGKLSEIDGWSTKMPTISECYA